MSLDHYHEVAKRSRATGSARSVLNCLAVRANDDNQCWPSRAQLAQEAGVTEKTVSRAIKELKELKEIEVKRNPYGQTYTICLNEMLRIVPSGIESDVTDCPAEGTNKDRDVTYCPQEKGHLVPLDVTDCPVKESKDINKDNIKTGKDKSPALVSVNEDFGIGLKFNKGVIQQTFGPQTKSIWPIAKELQIFCDVPGWSKFEDNLYEIVGYDDKPKPGDVERISKKYRKPGDDYWPSNFLRHWKRELLSPPAQVNQNESMATAYVSGGLKFQDLSDGLKASVKVTKADRRKRGLNEFEAKKLIQEIVHNVPA